MPSILLPASELCRLKLAKCLQVQSLQQLRCGRRNIPIYLRFLACVLTPHRSRTLDSGLTPAACSAVCRRARRRRAWDNSAPTAADAWAAAPPQRARSARCRGSRGTRNALATSPRLPTPHRRRRRHRRRRSHQKPSPRGPPPRAWWRRCPRRRLVKTRVPSVLKYLRKASWRCPAATGSTGAARRRGCGGGGPARPAAAASTARWKPRRGRRRRRDVV